MVVMMDIEISCKGHCEKLSHFLDHVSHTVWVKTSAFNDISFVILNLVINLDTC